MDVGTVIFVGAAVKPVIRTVKVEPLPIGLAGVTINSSPMRLKAAAFPLTATVPMLLPPKSRLNCESDCVARATIVSSPSHCLRGVRWSRNGGAGRSSDVVAAVPDARVEPVAEARRARARPGCTCRHGTADRERHGKRDNS